MEEWRGFLARLQPIVQVDPTDGQNFSVQRFRVDQNFFQRSQGVVRRAMDPIEMIEIADHAIDGESTHHVAKIRSIEEKMHEEIPLQTGQFDDQSFFANPRQSDENLRGRTKRQQFESVHSFVLRCFRRTSSRRFPAERRRSESPRRTDLSTSNDEIDSIDQPSSGFLCADLRRPTVEQCH